MNFSSRLSRTVFEQALTSQKIATLRIISAALASGILLFALVVIYFTFTTQADSPDGTDILLLLSGVHGLMALTIYAVAPLIYRKVLNSFRPESALTGEALAAEVIQKIMSAHMVRMAMYEGPALFGLVVCFLSVQWGHIPSQPEFLLNGITAVFFLLMTATTFPSRERLGSLFSEYFSG